MSIAEDGVMGILRVAHRSWACADVERKPPGISGSVQTQRTGDPLQVDMPALMAAPRVWASGDAVVHTTGAQLDDRSPHIVEAKDPRRLCQRSWPQTDNVTAAPRFVARARAVAKTPTVQHLCRLCNPCRRCTVDTTNARFRSERGNSPMIVRALSIAGSDPSGGAGIQADLKTFAAQGAYGMAVIASLTAQNTTGVRRVFSPPASFLAEQLTAISDDITVDAVKIGMLGSADNIGVVGRWLAAHRPPFVVLDPVMVATSGDRLLDPDAEQSLRALLPLADLLTPNVAELAVLVGGEPARDLDGAIAQGKALASTTGSQVLVKGGHLGSDAGGTGRQATDALVGPDGSVALVPGPWVDTGNTHGTGCSLSSALAALRPP